MLFSMRKEKCVTKEKPPPPPPLSPALVCVYQVFDFFLFAVSFFVFLTFKKKKEEIDNQRLRSLGWKPKWDMKLKKKIDDLFFFMIHFFFGTKILWESPSQIKLNKKK